MSMTPAVEDDPWKPRAPVPVAPGSVRPGGLPQVHVIADAGPLKDRVGPCVPAAMMPVLFPAAGPGAYAVLDGGVLPDLAGVLGASGLEHQCLFLDQAESAIRDVAPWLVRLTPEAGITRRLFTQGDSPWDLWGRGTWIVLRSPEGLADVARHLRKFTKVTTAARRTMFLKFWHEAVMNAFCAAGPDPLVAEFLGGVDAVYLASAPLAGPEMRLLTMGQGAA